MQGPPAENLLHYLQQVPDPRGRQGQRHDFVAMLATLVCAILSGCCGLSAMVRWIHLQEPKVWHQLGYQRRPPCYNTFRDLLIALAPELLQKVLWQWITEGLGLRVDEQELAAISLDGKTLRGTVSQHQRACQVLAMLDQNTGCVVNQTPVAEGTTEAKQAVELLLELVLEGKVIVGDAAFCQRDICQTIRDRGGHYLVVVKDNQPQLKRDIEQAFAESRAFSPLPTA